MIGNVEKMEYIQVQHEHDGWVLGQVMDMQRKTDLSLERAKMISQGEDVLIDEKVDRLGERGRLPRRPRAAPGPRTPFKAGLPVFKAKDEIIKNVIGLKENTPTGAYLGLLFGHDIRVEVDINSMVQKHVSILAKTGGGKSLPVRRPDRGADEARRHHHGLRPPRRVWRHARTRATSAKSHRNFNVTPHGYEDHIIEFATDTDVNPKAKPLRFTLGNIEAQGPPRADQHQERQDLPHLPAEGDRRASRVGQEGVRAEGHHQPCWSPRRRATTPPSSTSWSILDETARSSPRRARKIDELVVKGKMTIINLQGHAAGHRRADRQPHRHRAVRAAQAGQGPADDAGRARRRTTTARSRAWPPRRKIFRTIAAEGRKFGLGLTIISQRAAKIDKNVLCQCNTQMILKVTNPNDLKAITNSLEGIADGHGRRDPAPAHRRGADRRRQHPDAAVRRGAAPRESRHGGESVEIIPTKTT